MQLSRKTKARAAPTPRVVIGAPPLKENRNRRRSNATSEEVLPFPINSTFYPISRWRKDIKAAQTANAMYQVPLSYEIPATTNGSGIFATVYNDDPSNSTQWAELAGVYDSYRVLAFCVEWRPTLIIGGSTPTYVSALAVVSDRNDSAALASYVLAAEYGPNCKIQSGGAPWQRLSNMASTEDSTFLSCGSPAARAWIKTYSSGNTASTTIAQCLVTYLIEFRGVSV